MTKKRYRLIKISGFLLALAPALLGLGCLGFLGEPKIPKKLKSSK